MFTEEYPEFVPCPIAEKLIDFMDCVLTSDSSDGHLKEFRVPEETRCKPNWKEICQHCQFHGR